jgi:hypothetical protein
MREDKALTRLLRLEFTGQPLTATGVVFVEERAAEPPIRE